MACTNPIMARVEGVTENGKDKYKIHGHFNDRKFDDWDRTHPNYWTKFPCRVCLACKLDHSRMWAVRCLLEAKQFENNIFVTLTYDNKNLPWLTNENDLTGEITYSRTLWPDDLSKFIKRLRRKWEYEYNHIGIRFFGCGEYGSKKGRPHYHLILFNIKIPDPVFHMRNDYGDKLYTSQILSKIWGKGIVNFGNVTADSSAYVARYTTKKQTTNTQKRIPEFIRMSRNPGIARNYYEDNKDLLYEADIINYVDSKGLKFLKMPRYYDNLYHIDNPERMEELKIVRKLYGYEMSKSELKEFGGDPVALMNSKKEILASKTKNINKRENFVL